MKPPVAAIPTPKVKILRIMPRISKIASSLFSMQSLPLILMMANLMHFSSEELEEPEAPPEEPEEELPEELEPEEEPPEELEPEEEAFLSV